MTALEQLAAFVAYGNDRSAVALRETVRLHLVDIVAAWIAGTDTAEGRALLGLTKAMRGRPGLHSYGDTVLERAMLRCALVRLSEVDDIHLSSLTTPGAVVIPTALTVANELGPAACERLVDAVVVGYEAMIRLGIGLGGPRILYRGIWPTYFAAPFGAASTAARLLGLTEVQTAHALAMALTVTSPSIGHHQGPTTSRWISVGHAARSGVWAAFAAQEGFVGDPGILESHFFSSVYGITPDLSALTEGLGRDLALTGTSIKPWCAARQTMAAAQAMKEIVESGIAPAEITEVTAFVPGLQVKMIDHGVVPGDRTSYITSLPYQIALAALGSDAMFDVNQAPTKLSPEICALMNKIKVKPDDTLLSYYPSEWAARVVVTTAAGKCEREVARIPGDPRRPFSEEQVDRKFRYLTSPLIGAQAAEHILEFALKALDADGVAPLLGAIERGRGANPYD